MKKENVIIVGAGLIGSLLSIFLIKKGYRVSVYERRPDRRKSGRYEGRSINLALSDRGILALQRAGITSQLSDLIIPMKGRAIHRLDEELSFQPYGREGQAINSISRAQLNSLLIEVAEESGVTFHFEQAGKEVDFEKSEILVEDSTGHQTLLTSDLIVGADGAFSSIRKVMQGTDRFDYDQTYMQHGYKELTIQPNNNSKFALDPNALHIWPRERFMLIALPNANFSFTCTLFLPYEGPNSFKSLGSPKELSSFFSKFFPDTKNLIEDLEQDFFQNPTSSLITIRCGPWIRNRTFLIGDACHAIVPFYGQGMNAGFEDCRILDELIDEHDHDWNLILSKFYSQRKKDADAIRDLALQNFVEMIDLVGDPRFLLRKQIEAHLHELFPERWVPQYSMVTFSHMPYAEALAAGEKKRKVMDEVMKMPSIETNWRELDFDRIIRQVED